MTTLLPRRSHVGVTTAPVSDRIRRSWAPLSVGVLAFATSLIGMTTASIWYDEAATITAATRSWPQLWAMAGTVDAVHAAYYVLMHLVFDLFGYSPLALRLPSAIAVGLTAALLVLFARQFGRPRLGVVAAIVFMLLPRTTWMSTEGRSYAITALLALVLTMALIRAVHAKSRRSWVVYGILVVVSCTVFIYLALVVVAHGLSMLRWISLRTGNAGPTVRRWLATAAVAALALVPLGLLVVAESGQVHWLDEPSRAFVRQVGVTQWFYTSVPFAVVGWCLLVAGCVFLSGRRGLSLGSIVVPLIVAPTALLVLASFVMPLYTPRYVAMCLPFVAIAIGAALDRLPYRAQIAIALAAMATLAVPQLVEQRQPEAREVTDWSAVADWVAADRAADGADSSTAIVYGNVYGHPTATTRVIAYAYPSAFADTIDVTLDTPAAETGRLWESRLPLAETVYRAADADVTYLVTSTSRDRRPAVIETMQDAGWRVVDTEDFPNLAIVKFER